MKKILNIFILKIFPILLILTFVIIINYRIFPLTEGWWETYAWLSFKQKIYIDFNLSFPALFINLNQIILHFTENLLIIRWIGIFIYIFNIFLSYKLCRLVTKSKFCLLGILASQILIICNNPVWISGDYHIFVAILLNCFCFFLYKFLLNNHYKNFYLIFLGIFTSLIVLSKQNIAIICIFSTIFTIFCEESKNYKSKNDVSKILKKNFNLLIIYFIAIIIVLLLYSYFFGANWVNTYINLDSKGDPSVIFLRFLKISETKITIILTLILIFFSLRKKLLKQKKNDNLFQKLLIISNEQKIILGYIFIFFFFYFVINRRETEIFYSCILTFFTFNIYKYFKLRDKNIFNCFSITLILIAYSGTMTAGYNYVSLELLIIISITIFLDFFRKKFSTNMLYVSIILILLGSLSFYRNKIYNPYNWWGYGTDSIFNSKFELKDNNKLAGIKMDLDTFDIMQLTKNYAGKLKYDETFFSYPNIPMFYWLYDKKPPVSDIVQWFDFMQSNRFEIIEKELKKNSPKIIFWLKPSKGVYAGHYNLIQKVMPIEKIDKYLEFLIMNNKYKISESIIIIHDEYYNKNRYDKIELKNTNVNVNCFINKCHILKDKITESFKEKKIIEYEYNQNTNSRIKLTFETVNEMKKFVRKNKIYGIFDNNSNDYWTFYILEKIN
jgi:hypothetical protein